MDYVVRFFIGGAVVSLFAVLGDMLRPKSFAGLFGAAPSVALVTLTLAFYREGPLYVADETRGMFAGAVALGVYGVCVCHLLMKTGISALRASLVSLAAWLGVAISLRMLIAG